MTSKNLVSLLGTSPKPSPGIPHLRGSRAPGSSDASGIAIATPSRPIASHGSQHVVLADLAAGWWGVGLAGYTHTCRQVMGDPSVPATDPSDSKLRSAYTI